MLAPSRERKLEDSVLIKANVSMCFCFLLLLYQFLKNIFPPSLVSDWGHLYPIILSVSVDVHSLDLWQVVLTSSFFAPCLDLWFSLLDFLRCICSFVNKDWIIDGIQGFWWGGFFGSHRLKARVSHHIWQKSAVSDCLINKNIDYI